MFIENLELRNKCEAMDLRSESSDEILYSIYKGEVLIDQIDTSFSFVPHLIVEVPGFGNVAIKPFRDECKAIKADKISGADILVPSVFCFIPFKSINLNMNQTPLKPIVFFDLETTGTNMATDRIVSIACQRISGDLQTREEMKHYLINPGIPIPPEASAVHGITDSMVKEAPLFKELAGGLIKYLEGCDLGGFNIISFDVPLLVEELHRAGRKIDLSGVRFMDAYKIFAQKERRDLTSAVAFYCKETLEGAHDAGNDVKASIDVLIAQLNHYDDLKVMNAYDIDNLCRPVKTLDFAGCFIEDEKGVPMFNFGKNKGKPVKSDAQYCYKFMLPGAFTENTKEVLREILVKIGA